MGGRGAGRGRGLTTEKLFLLGDSGTVVLLPTASAPWCPCHASAGRLHTEPSQDRGVWRVLTTTDVTRGVGGLNCQEADREMLFQAYCACFRQLQ